ncbi:transcriptional regulator BolA [Vibrio sp. WXL103]|uniref:transcriptional regulator BolA n=1 Tax=unclassified Vibrio TaxID=2614977 RepID=UPI003EC7C6CB
MIQETIETKLHSTFDPSHLQVIDESYMHSVPVGSESHFKVIIVAKEFEGQRLIARHRMVNQALADELANDIHALAMHTYTEEEWRLEQGFAPNSPQCMGGGK